MPETPTFEPEAVDKPKIQPEQQTEKNEAQSESVRRVIKQKLNKLEESDISGELKELMSGWIENNLQGESLNAYADKIKERGSSITLGELLEGMADIYLGQNPDLAKKFQNGEIDWSHLADGMFDLTFQFALNSNSAPERAEQRKEVERILARFKEIVYE